MLEHVFRRRPLADAFDESLFELNKDIVDVPNPAIPRSPERRSVPKRKAVQRKRGSRPSDVLNEDNYDFAICLKPLSVRNWLVSETTF